MVLNNRCNLTANKNKCQLFFLQRAKKVFFFVSLSPCGKTSSTQRNGFVIKLLNILLHEVLEGDTKLHDA
ncbi:MAG: hypothetical protein COZ80_07080 [Ignavibacteria bacterium CG_4_8_14_3_um_filter_37_9]|nr:MAG: hypothetical protein AUJ54_08745 [Ignavibacteria bacterium CG1_02_37_35]PIW99121.1 MAG: hypothetical protein COZ80_07080 [Ignavibacteria bacterium CG_4_8_14_3_um_filter_37_9]